MNIRPLILLLPYPGLESFLNCTGSIAGLAITSGLFSVVPQVLSKMTGCLQELALRKERGNGSQNCHLTARKLCASVNNGRYGTKI